MYTNVYKIARFYYVIFLRMPDATQNFRILSFVSYKYEIWCLTSREENKLPEFSKQVFGKIYGHENVVGNRIWHKEKFLDL
jgi:hypothetical protein